MKVQYFLCMLAISSSGLLLGMEKLRRAYESDDVKDAAQPIDARESEKDRSGIDWDKIYGQPRSPTTNDSKESKKRKDIEKITPPSKVRRHDTTHKVELLIIGAPKEKVSTGEGWIPKFSLIHPDQLPSYDWLNQQLGELPAASCEDEDTWDSIYGK